MSEKRFFEIDYDEVYYIIDSSRLQRKKTAFEDEEEYQEYCLENSFMGTQVVDLLNSLSEENEQLKQEKDKYRVMINANASLNDEVYEQLKKTEKSYKECREENEQLKEQLQMIKEIIQTQITETEEHLQTSIRGGMPTGSLYSEIELLQKLKKECLNE